MLCLDPSPADSAALPIPGYTLTKRAASCKSGSSSSQAGTALPGLCVCLLQRQARNRLQSYNIMLATEHQAWGACTAESLSAQLPRALDPPHSQLSRQPPIQHTFEAPAVQTQNVTRHHSNQHPHSSGKCAGHSAIIRMGYQRRPAQPGEIACQRPPLDYLTYIHTHIQL